MLEKLLANVADLVLSVGVKIVITIVILVVGFRAIKWLMSHMKNGKLLSRADASVRSFIVSFSSVALKIVLLIVAASYIGVPMASLITLLGSACVAIGIALQGGLSNIAGGMMIIFFRPFSVGDYIENGGNGGTVSAIGLFHTTLTTPENIHIVIPNSLLTSQTVVNYSSETRRRIDIDFSVSYSSDIDTVKKALLDTAGCISGIITDPLPEAVLFSHDDSALVFRLRVWCPSESYWDIRFKLMEDVKRKFDEKGIEIPFPQMDVHINEDKFSQKD